MKKILLMAVFIMASLQSSLAQKSFVIEKSEDLNIPTEQIYSITEKFVKDYWSSGKEFDVEKEPSSSISVKSSYEYLFNGMMKRKYVYRYTVNFIITGTNILVEVINVNCIQARQYSMSESNFMEVPKVQPFDGDKPIGRTTTTFGDGIGKKNAIKLMAELRGHLESIVNEYFIFAKEKSATK